MIVLDSISDYFWDFVNGCAGEETNNIESDMGICIFKIHRFNQLYEMV